ncbi:MAG TPA: M20/M25/M40 family metallo-hydrolase [Pyrinomonadaceae bacterium]|jgi:acetylornithine deacetylase/succinyl-diaminopimelate desuccinylase-like protein|nr:M20/M25/M40 family metallo-hydrolase [Pyrinomonadaceae bacterium]
MTRRTPLIFIASLLLCHAAAAQAVNSVREYRRAHEHRIFSEFVQLLSLPNVASDRENIRRNAAHISEMMRARGLNPRLLEATTPNVPPAVYGEWKVAGAARTLIFYAHYDGQPTDPAKWTGTRPWEPTLRDAPFETGGKILTAPAANDPINPEWRLYARSSSDDKAGVMAILTAFDALKARGVAPTVNLKFFFEGEEEAGSPHLVEIMSGHKELLASDAWIICDGPVHQSGRKQVVFGVRGDTNVDVTVYGAKRPLHSGHYGNWAPNPAMVLAKLLASMKDDAGRVTVQGWYDDAEPLGSAEQRAIAEAPAYDDRLKKELGVARPEGAGKSLLELINQPSLNVNGMTSAETGALSRNVIPTTATAALDLRLVKGNDFRRQVERLVAHIKRQGFHVVDHDPTDAERAAHPLVAKVTHRAGGYNAERTPMDLPVSLSVVDAVQATSAEKIVRMPTLGGSLPLSLIRETLNVPTITVPIANYDNNQHAENENIRLQNLWDGIDTYAALMTMRPPAK